MAKARPFHRAKQYIHANAPIPGFFSTLDELVATSPREAMTAKEWEQWLQPGRMLEREGVQHPLKKSELEDNRMSWFLNSANAEPDERGMIPRSRIFSYLEHNRPRFSGRINETPEMREALSREGVDWADRLIEIQNQLEAPEARFQQSPRSIRNLGGQYGTLHTLKPAQYGRLDLERPRFQHYNFHHKSMDMPEDGYFELVTNYMGPNSLSSTSQHFDSNTLSWSRGTRHYLTAPDEGYKEGERVRLIEEVQSDYHQKGRDRGYRPENYDELDKVYTEDKQANQELLEQTLGITSPIDPELRTVRDIELILARSPDPEAESLYQNWRRADKRLKELRDTMQPAPFSDTKDYFLHELEKNAIAAVDEGDQYLAIVRGDDQVHRYRDYLDEKGRKGTRHAYDVIYPSVMKKFAKKYGGEYIEELPLRVKEAYVPRLPTMVEWGWENVDDMHNSWLQHIFSSDAVGSGEVVPSDWMSALGKLDSVFEDVTGGVTPDNSSADVIDSIARTGRRIQRLRDDIYNAVDERRIRDQLLSEGDYPTVTDETIQQYQELNMLPTGPYYESIADNVNEIVQDLEHLEDIWTEVEQARAAGRTDTTDKTFPAIRITDEMRKRIKQGGVPLFAKGGRVKEVSGLLQRLRDSVGPREEYFSTLGELIEEAPFDKAPPDQWKGYLQPGRMLSRGDTRFPLKKSELEETGMASLLEMVPEGDFTHFTKEDLLDMLQEKYPKLKQDQLIGPINVEYGESYLRTPPTNPRLDDLYSEDLTRIDAKDHYTGHFDGDIVSWSRVTRHDTPTFDKEGNRLPSKVRLIDEIQSDIHQRGREIGYGRAPKIDLPELFVTKNPQATERYRYNLWIQRDPNDRSPRTRFSHDLWGSAASPEEVVENYYTRNADPWASVATENLHKGLYGPEGDDFLVQVFPDEKEIYQELQEVAGVPNWPFKKTEEYAQLELTKQLLNAIDDGDEYLAIVPGEQQVKRNRLSGERAKGTEHVYDKIYPSVLKKLAKRYGAEYETINVPVRGQSRGYFRTVVERYDMDDMMENWGDLMNDMIGEAVWDGDIDLMSSGLADISGALDVYQSELPMVPGGSREIWNKAKANLERLKGDLAKMEQIKADVDASIPSQSDGQHSRARYTAFQNDWGQYAEDNSKSIDEAIARLSSSLKLLDEAYARLKGGSEMDVIQVPALKITPEVAERVKEIGVPTFAKGGKVTRRDVLKGMLGALAGSAGVGKGVMKGDPESALKNLENSIKAVPAARDLSRPFAKNVLTPAEWDYIKEGLEAIVENNLEDLAEVRPNHVLGPDDVAMVEADLDIAEGILKKADDEPLSQTEHMWLQENTDEWVNDEGLNAYDYGGEDLETTFEMVDNLNREMYTPPEVVGNWKKAVLERNPNLDPEIRAEFERVVEDGRLWDNLHEMDAQDFSQYFPDVSKEEALRKGKMLEELFWKDLTQKFAKGGKIIDAAKLFKEKRKERAPDMFNQMKEAIGKRPDNVLDLELERLRQAEKELNPEIEGQEYLPPTKEFEEWFADFQAKLEARDAEKKAKMELLDYEFEPGEYGYSTTSGKKFEIMYRDVDKKGDPQYWVRDPDGTEHQMMAWGLSRKPLEPADLQKNKQIFTADHMPWADRDDYERIFSALEDYTERWGEFGEVQIVKDPRRPGIFAAVDIDSIEDDYISGYIIDTNQEGDILDAIEEVEFTQWPPNPRKGYAEGGSIKDDHRPALKYLRNVARSLAGAVPFAGQKEAFRDRAEELALLPIAGFQTQWYGIDPDTGESVYAGPRTIFSEPMDPFDRTDNKPIPGIIDETVALPGFPGLLAGKENLIPDVSQMAMQRMEENEDQILKQLGIEYPEGFLENLLYSGGIMAGQLPVPASMIHRFGKPMKEASGWLAKALRLPDAASRAGVEWFSPIIEPKLSNYGVGSLFGAGLMTGMESLTPTDMEMLEDAIMQGDAQAVAELKARVAAGDPEAEALLDKLIAFIENKKIARENPFTQEHLQSLDRLDMPGYAKGGHLTRAAKEMVGPPRRLYHVTFTENVPRINEEGIKAQEEKNWRMGSEEGDPYGEAETIYSFDNFTDALRWASKMDWDFHQGIGTGGISIIAHDTFGGWREDLNDPLSRLGNLGMALKKQGKVEPYEITKVLTVDQDLARMLSKAFPGEVEKPKGFAKGGKITRRKFVIWDPKEDKQVGKPYNNKKRARTRIDKLDNEYGAYRYRLRELLEDGSTKPAFAKGGPISRRGFLKGLGAAGVTAVAAGKAGIKGDPEDQLRQLAEALEAKKLEMPPVKPRGTPFRKMTSYFEEILDDMRADESFDIEDIADTERDLENIRKVADLIDQGHDAEAGNILRKQFYQEDLDEAWGNMDPADALEARRIYGPYSDYTTYEFGDLPEVEKQQLRDEAVRVYQEEGEKGLSRYMTKLEESGMELDPRLEGEGFDPEEFIPELKQKRLAKQAEWDRRYEERMKDIPKPEEADGRKFRGWKTRRDRLLKILNDRRRNPESEVYDKAYDEWEDLMEEIEEAGYRSDLWGSMFKEF